MKKYLAYVQLETSKMLMAIITLLGTSIILDAEANETEK